MYIVDIYELSTNEVLEIKTTNEKKNLKYNDASWYSALIFSENMLVITMVIIKGSSILRKSV